MNKTLLICLLFVNCAFSQGKKSPLNFNYDQQSNYFINERGVYADTVLFAHDFPDIKFTQEKSPLDSVTLVGYSSLKGFSNKEKKMLISLLYHNTQKISGTYDRDKNKTVFTITRNDQNLKKIFKNYFKEPYHKFKYTVIINYNKKSIKTRFPSNSFTNNFKEVEKEIIFPNPINSNVGTYITRLNNVAFTNIVFLNEKYSDKIVPEVLFSNNSFGVEKIISLESTITLKDNNYE